MMDAADWFKRGWDPQEAAIMSQYSCVQDSYVEKYVTVEKDKTATPCSKVDIEVSSRDKASFRKQQSRAKRRLNFESPNTNEKKRRRTVLANKAKRQRYKKNKNEKWKTSKKYFQSTCSQQYDKTIESEADDDNMEQSSYQRNPVLNVTDSCAVKEAYTIVQEECEQEGLHLLPALEVSTNNIIHKLKRETEREKELELYANERDKALQDALHFRMLAEKREDELQEVKTKMHHRITAVRNFWRNECVEGRSRAGAIVKKSLSCNGNSIN